jgi:hypothetical protein
LYFEFLSVVVATFIILYVLVQARYNVRDHGNP